MSHQINNNLFSFLKLLPFSSMASGSVLFLVPSCCCLTERTWVKARPMRISHSIRSFPGGHHLHGRRKPRRVKQNSAGCKAQPSAQTFTIEGFDSALERGEIEVCWQQILNLKERIKGDDQERLQQGGSSNVCHDLSVRSIDQLTYDPADTESSSAGEHTQIGTKDEGWRGGNRDSEESGDDQANSLMSRVGGNFEIIPTENEVAGALNWQKHMLKEILLGRHKKFIKQCIATSRKDLLVEYMRMLPAQERVFSWLLRECLRARDCDGVLQVLEVRKEVGIEPDKYSYSALISALVRLGDMEGAKISFNEAIDKGITSLYLYNAMIDGYGRSGDVDGAMKIWETLHLNGLVPDAFTYTGMIRTMGTAQRIDEMKSLLLEMISLNLKPMPHTFTIMFDASSGCSQQDAEWLLSLCDVMDEFSISLNNHILSAMITALAHVPLTTKQIDIVFDKVDKFRSSVGPAAAMVYSSLLLFCGRQGIHERVVNVWNAMLDDGVKANCHIYSAALTTCSLDQAEDSLVVDFALQIGDQLENEWQMNKNHDQSSLLIAFNSLVNAYCTLCGMDKAMTVYRSMQMNGPKPDLITCNTLLAGFSSDGILDSALQIKEYMHKSGIQPSGRTYVALLTCCARAYEPDLAWDMFREMVESGINAPVEAYTALMDAFVKDKSDEYLNRAFALLDTLKKEGLKPTAVTYGCLLMGCWYNGDVDRAFSLYKEAYESNIVPTDACHNILINMCTFSDRLDEALEVVKNLAQRHGSIEHDTLNSLVRSLAKNNPHRAIVVLRLMQSRKMEASRETYHELIVSCSQNAFSGLALELYKQMRKRGIKGSRRVGSSLIMAECNACRINGAMSIAVDMMRCAGVQDLEKILQIDLPNESTSRIFEKNAIQDRSQLPEALALGTLCCGLVQEKQLAQGMQMFRLVKTLEGDQGLGTLISRLPYMFECLIESNCSMKRVDDALEVFDTWKASATLLLSKNKVLKGDEWAYKRYPQISQASLAFLKATCQCVSGMEWRVLDVCASMRQQREWAHEATLPRPQPFNHHFLDPN